MTLVVREAGPGDAATIVALVKELAAFEGMAGRARMSEADVLRDGFGERRHFECLLVEEAGEILGLAVFYGNYSTFAGRPGLFLEDIFVREAARGRGVGRLLMQRLAALALARGCVQLELTVLHWNPARAFYQRLGFAHSADWLPYRLEGEAIARLAAVPAERP
jgi:GNAT superfamily N-acetyltransferase